MLANVMLQLTLQLRTAEWLTTVSGEIVPTQATPKSYRQTTCKACSNTQQLIVILNDCNTFSSSVPAISAGAQQ